MKLVKNWQGYARIGFSLLFSLILWLGIPTFQALAQPTPASTHHLYLAENLLENDSQVSQERKKRVEGVEDCRQYLTHGDNQTIAHTDAPLDQSGSKHLVGALKATDQPETTKAELAFKRCLEQRGVAPKTGEPIPEQ